MKYIITILILIQIVGCTNKPTLNEGDPTLIEIDRQAISEIAVTAISKERPFLTPSDLSLLRVNYVYLNRADHPVKQSSSDNPYSAEMIKATMLVKPTATLIRGVSGDGKDFSAFWHQEAVVEIRTNTGVRVQFLTQGHEGSSSHPNYATVLKGYDLWDIVEASLRHMFRNNASAAQQRAPAYFISFLRRDPPASFFQRFSELSIPVLPGSTFETGKGLKFYVRSIAVSGDESVIVQAGYYEGNLSSSGDTLTLRKEDGKWKVVEAKQDWIS